jgi:hypothetical protein
LIAFASEKINQLSSHTFGVGGARRDEERHVDQTTAGHVFSDRTKKAMHWLGLSTRGENPHAALTAMVFANFCASALFGRVSVSKPLEKDASIFVSSTSWRHLERALERAVASDI